MKELLTSAELAKYFKVTEQTIYNWRKEGIPSIKIGREYRYELGKVMEWLRKRGDKDE